LRWRSTGAGESGRAGRFRGCQGEHRDAFGCHCRDARRRGRVGGGQGPVVLHDERVGQRLGVGNPGVCGQLQEELRTQSRGAEFVAAINGELANYENVDRLAGIAGLSPVPHDSGRVIGNLKRPRRYDRRLLRACYLAAHNSLRTNPASRAFYDRKRTEGKRHSQAVLALARRRLNVLWAIIRDETTYAPTLLKAA
jgi:hypothetical protein